MARGSALAGSLAVHGAIALLAVVLATREQHDERAGAGSLPVAIELVSAPPAPAAPMPRAGGGSSPAISMAAPLAPRHARLVAPRASGSCSVFWWNDAPSRARAFATTPEHRHLVELSPSVGGL